MTSWVTKKELKKTTDPLNVATELYLWIFAHPYGCDNDNVHAEQKSLRTHFFLCVVALKALNQYHTQAKAQLRGEHMLLVFFVKCD